VPGASGRWIVTVATAIIVPGFPDQQVPLSVHGPRLEGDRFAEAAAPGQARRHSRSECISQCTEQRCPVATPRAAVHAREGVGVGHREPLQHRARMLRVGEIIQSVAEGLARSQNVRRGERRKVTAALREQITA